MSAFRLNDATPVMRPSSRTTTVRPVSSSDAGKMRSIQCAIGHGLYGPGRCRDPLAEGVADARDVARGIDDLHGRQGVVAWRQRVERHPVFDEDAGELVAHPAVRGQHRGEEGGERHAAIPRTIEQRADARRRESARAVLRQGRDAPDPRAADRAAAEPMIEPELAGNRDDIVALDSDTQVVERKERSALHGAFAGGVQRDSEDLGDRQAVLLAGRDDRHGKGHPHGAELHRGHPSA